MKNIVKHLILLVIVLIIKTNVYAENTNIRVFYSETCPHCHKELEFLDKLKVKYPDITIETYEVSKNTNNQLLFKEAAEKLGEKATSVPYTIINGDSIIGYQTDETTGKKIEGYLKRAEVSNVTYTDTNLHVFGVNLDIKHMSLPVLTILIGVLDGFNPCAMWVLLFLLGMLINSGNKKKLYILGVTFILITAIMYFMFLAAWLNIFMFIGYNKWINILIGVVALYMGIKYLNEYFKKDSGCTVTENENRKEIFYKIKNIISKNNLVLSILGVALLAISINFVELLCSAGLPTIYTQILSTSGISKISYYMYLSLYVLFFVIDDLIIFIIAITTFETVGISNKYTKISQLIGGITMILIGLNIVIKLLI